MVYIYIYTVYIYTVYTLIKNSAVKRLITINHIQNKSFCLHNIKAHTYSIYFENIYMYLHVYIYIHIIYIIYKYIQYINFFFLYLYIHNKYTQYTHTYFYIQLLFWMWLIAINRLTPLIKNNKKGLFSILFTKGIFKNVHNIKLFSFICTLLHNVAKMWQNINIEFLMKTF